MNLKQRWSKPSLHVKSCKISYTYVQCSLNRFEFNFFTLIFIIYSLWDKNLFYEYMIICQIVV